jgi:hypothetical protein
VLLTAPEVAVVAGVDALLVVELFELDPHPAAASTATASTTESRRTSDLLVRTV